MCFFNRAEQTYLQQNEPFSTLKTMVWQEVLLSKLTQFSEGDNGLDAAASIAYDFLWSDTHASSLQLNRPFGRTSAYLLIESPNFQEVFLSKIQSIPTKKQFATVLCV